MTLHRRDFLKASAGSLATLSALNAFGAGQKANDKIVIAVMGVGKGMSHYKPGVHHGRGYGQMERLVKGFGKEVEIGYICDVDSNLIPGAVNLVRGGGQNRAVKVEKDIRKVLEDKSVDAVMVMTPDHWHALATIWACQAGKHVYVEKPISHNYNEGKKMVEAARKYKVVVQGGTQRRSAPFYRSAAKYIKDGNLGKVPFVRTWIAGDRPNLGHPKDSPEPPKGVDYDLWLGPCPKTPFNKNRFHYEWHWFWDLGTGELGNNGVHALDGVRILLGLDAPHRISSGGGKYFYDDARITPDTQAVTWDFKDTCLLWEHRIWSKTGFEGENWGIALYGSKGTMIFDKKGWHVVDGNGAKEVVNNTDTSEAHLRNFIDCIKASTPGNPKLPNCDIEEAHKSTRLCHLGNIAYRTGRTLHFDAATDSIKNDAAANKLLSRPSYGKGFELPAKV